MSVSKDRPWGLVRFMPGTPIDRIKQKSYIKEDLKQSVRHWSMSESFCFRSLRI